MSKPIHCRNVLMSTVLAFAFTLPLNSYAKSDIGSPSVQSSDSLITPQIVGGEVADQQNWPWMTAYVLTFQGVDSSLVVNGFNYQTRHFTAGPDGNETAEIVSCGDGQAPCSDAQNKICLIERGINTFAEKALNCENEGGVGAIIYNNVEGSISGTVGNDFTGTIPLVAVTKADGEQLLTLVGETAQIRVAAVSNLQQDSTCGGSFIGDKWVITAAHCVDSPNAFLFQMNVGEYDLSDGAENATPIANIYMHPDYDVDAINNDIALVELTESINATPIKIASKTLTDQVAASNSTVTVAGWGGRLGYVSGEGPTDDFPDVLHKVDLTLLSNAECEQRFSSGTITDAMLCATSTLEQGSCQGDSGGPLVVDTNTGLQQVGIVSFGVGCADPEYPGVYTRIAEFSDWIDTIKDGIAIQQLQDFGIMPVNQSTTAELNVTNNSDITTSVTFSIQGDTDFSIDTNSCNTLAPNSSCELTVSYTPQTVGEHLANIVISADSSQIKLSQAKLVGYAVNTANALAGVAGPTNSRVTWYSGGDRAWTSNATDGVESGNISHRQDSILLALIDGAGSLSFDWGVSSEANEDDATDPYDILELHIDGQLVEFISGEIDVQTYADENNLLTFGDGFHIITWVYSKDPATDKGQDKGFVRNVTFVPDQTTTPTTPTEPPSNNSSSSGGGSAWWLLIMIGGMVVHRRFSQSNK